MSLILMTTLFYKAVILHGEIWRWSLLGLEGLNEVAKWKTCLEQVQGFEGLAACATLNRSFPWVLPSASTDSFVICLVINFQHWQLNENQRYEFFLLVNIGCRAFVFQAAENTIRIAVYNRICMHPDLPWPPLSRLFHTLLDILPKFSLTIHFLLTQSNLNSV